MDETLESLNEKIKDLESQMNEISISGSTENLASISKEYHKYIQIRDLKRNLEKNTTQLHENKEIDTEDEDMLVLIETENKELSDEITKIELELQKLTQIPLPDDDKASIIEFRAGTGGTEAALFTEELLRMYTRYCNEQGWKVEASEINYETEGGIKTAILNINSKESYAKLRFESGVHRVQRVPSTESSGRIHTSAASVAILPQVDDVQVVIKDEDLKVDVYRSSGPGGQSVNTTDSAVRLTHTPTGITVSCQDGKSQLKNKEKALKILAAKIQSIKTAEQEAEIANSRNSQIKTGDRSEKIRTYNFPQSRVTDHRIKKSWFNINDILEGDLSDVIEEVQSEMRR